MVAGTAATERGDTPAAKVILDEALAIARDASLPGNTGTILLRRAEANRRDGQWQAAQDDADEAAAILAVYGDAVGLTDGLEILGGIAIQTGDAERGARLFGAAARIRDEIGYRRLPIHEPTYDADLCRTERCG